MSEQEPEDEASDEDGEATEPAEPAEPEVPDNWLDPKPFDPSGR